MDFLNRTPAAQALSPTLTNETHETERTKVSAKDTVNPSEEAPYRRGKSIFQLHISKGLESRTYKELKKL